MRRKTRTLIPYHLLILLCGVVCGQGITLEEIRNTPELTPRKFAAFFKNFQFDYRTEIQKPEVFLKSRSGDCDDYATLAAEVLREKGYTPRLIAIRMPQIVHVVCYIEETQSFLDYNKRSYVRRTVKCPPDLRAIAAKVAESYYSSWSSVSEFTFDGRMKRLVATVVDGQNGPTDPKQVASVFR